jgi:hypothetical protein
LTEEQFDALLQGRTTIGRLDRAWAAARLIDSAPYAEVVRRIGFPELLEPPRRSPYPANMPSA